MDDEGVTMVLMENKTAIRQSGNMVAMEEEGFDDSAGVGFHFSSSHFCFSHLTRITFKPKMVLHESV
ncbi:hypothetical protein [Alkalihalobacillus sp. AL-G]|uniref:hypothetical protein n=1 Tax=Alkalihalobacillus sp. AL-G TaxID=2926399 RepID=UPI00272C19C2|nr:hypothetical protein [Alkalihalobacillus sp. AL-G]WLD91693.1 hypothetical protein MOJ78_11630 [Alkalihalobacillus sp. AL-G]